MPFHGDYVRPDVQKMARDETRERVIPGPIAAGRGILALAEDRAFSEGARNAFAKSWIIVDASAPHLMQVDELRALEEGQLVFGASGIALVELRYQSSVGT